MVACQHLCILYLFDISLKAFQCIIQCSDFISVDLESDYLPLNIQGIPYNWKTVHIVSIYKKGTKYNSENYDFSDMHLLQTTIFWDN
jgi:hypothetical protein